MSLNYKASEVIEELAKLISKYGDLDVKLCLMSDNDDLEMGLDSIEIYLVDGKAKKIELVGEIDDVKKFKQMIKTL